jgi:hypothetical protein
MTLPGVTISRQLEDIEFIKVQFWSQPNKRFHEHYRSILSSLCRRLLSCDEFEKMLKQEAIYSEQIKTIRQKITEIEKDLPL